MADDWIREQARRHRDEDEARQRATDAAFQAEQRRLAITTQQLPRLWQDFGAALAQKIKIYNDQYGKPVLGVQIDAARRIVVRGERGKLSVTATLKVDDSQRWIQSELVKRVDTSERRGSLIGVPSLATQGEALTFRYENEGREPLTPDGAADAFLQAILKELDK